MIVIKRLVFNVVKFFMDIIDVPMSWVQRKFGTLGMAMAMLLPNMSVFFLFILFPMGLNIAYSLTGGSALFLENRVYVGTEQYASLFEGQSWLNPGSMRHDEFWIGVHNTFWFVIIQVSLTVVVALATALVLNKKIRFKGFWRGLFFFPVLLSPVVVGLLWKWILQRDGLLNAILMYFGQDRVLWLSDRFWAMFWSIFVSVWSQVGFYALILLAGLQAIPSDIYEAAEMDGTKPWRAFRKLTMPLLWPNLVVVLTLALIKAVQIFDVVFVLTGGGPGTATQFITQFIYQTGFANAVRNMGLASAASILMALVLVVLTSLQMLASAKQKRQAT